MAKLTNFIFMVSLLISTISALPILLDETTTTMDPTTTTYPIDIDCTIAGNGSAIFVPHPYECEKYFECQDQGGAIPMTCPDGLVFDPDLQICNWPWLVDCENTPYPTKPTTTMVPETSTPTKEPTTQPPTTLPPTTIPQTTMPPTTLPPTTLPPTTLPPTTLPPTTSPPTTLPSTTLPPTTQPPTTQPPNTTTPKPTKPPTTTQTLPITIDRIKRHPTVPTISA